MTQSTYKAVRAFQNNGPDYWLIYRGTATFGADPVARCDQEAEAQLVVAALNATPVPPQPQADNVWLLSNKCDEYTDYQQHLADHKEVGGVVTITLTDDGGAYGTIAFDTVNGDEVVGPREFSLSREQAEQIVGIATAEGKE